MSRFLWFTVYKHSIATVCFVLHIRCRKQNSMAQFMYHTIHYYNNHLIIIQVNLC